MIKINKETITKVKLYDFEELKQYKYVEKDIIDEYFFGLFKETIAKVGEYEDTYNWDRYCDAEYFNKKRYKILNKRVYDKPCVVIFTADGKSTIKWFDDYTSAVNFYKELTNENKWLKM